MADFNKPLPLNLKLDYFRGPSRVERWKGKLGAWALGVTLLGLVVSFGVTREAHFGASPGPVSSPHQAWDQSCSACHESFTAISGHSWTPPGMAHATGEKCQTCHAGPVHHSTQKPDLNCASCHREHRGVDASLLKIGDADCTQCHARLADHCLQKTDFADVSAFARGAHPDFRSLKEDPGRIKFDHARHMTPGMPLRDKKSGLGGAVFTLGKIADPDSRKRYRDMQSAKDDDAPVQLSCRSCHELDAGDFDIPAWHRGDLGPGLATPRSSGRYFQPIAYENQCKACHPLQVQTVAGGGGEPLAVPHRKQPVEIDRWLEDYFTAQAARGLAGFWEMKATRPLPGKRIPDLLPPELKKLITVNLRQASRDLYEPPRPPDRFPAGKNCVLCHDLKQAIGADLGGGLEPPAEPDRRSWYILGSNIPQVWFKHASFDHMAHRAVDCRECHAAAYGLKADGTANPGASVSSSDVLVPNMDNCVQCHAPRSAKSIDLSAAAGGIRHDCVLCHRYHNGEHPLAGRGARARGAPRPGSIDQFLGGFQH